MRASWNCVSQLIRISLATKVPVTRGLGCVGVHPSSFSQRLEVKFSSLAPTQVDLLQRKAVFPDRHQILQLQPLSWSIWRTYAKKGKDKGMLLYFRNSIESMHPSQRWILNIDTGYFSAWVLKIPPIYLSHSHSLGINFLFSYYLIISSTF